jgi:hypothetical protein
MKAYVEVKVLGPLFLTLTVDERDWSASCFGLFTPGEKVPSKCVEGWMGPSVGLRRK